MLPTVLLAVAGAIYVLLGALHGWLTWGDTREPKVIVPRDPALVKAMRGMPLRIDPGTDFWRAWIGFNYSHSLGLALFGAVLLGAALLWPEAFRHGWGLRTGCVAVALAYVGLARVYFFAKPFAATTLALGLVVAAALLA